MTHRGLGAGEREADSWHRVTFGEVRDFALRLAAWLRTEREIKPGQRVGILSENRLEVVIVLLATHACGAIAAPLYPGYSPEQVEYACHAFNLDFLFTSNRAQEQKIKPSRPKLLFESEIFRNIVTSYQPLTPEQRASIGDMSPAFIVATSGTIGEAKGALIPHYGIYHSTERVMEFGLPTKWKRIVSILPLFHLSGLTDLYSTAIVHGEMWMVERKEELLNAFRDARPSHFVCVPNLFVKVKETIEARMRQGSILKRFLFWWAMGLGRRRLAGTIKLSDRLLLPIAERLIFKKTKALFGGKIEEFGTTGAQLPQETYDFYWSLGMPLIESYGLTETGILTSNRLSDSRQGTVGRPMPETSIRIAEDGEIQVKDKNRVLGYVNAPFELTSDGYFATGDLGRFTDEGTLQIIGRKKELIILNTGENIAPVKVEAAIKRSPRIEDAVCVGDGRKFLSIALVPAAGSRLDDPEGEIEKYSEGLATFERPKKYFVIPEIPAKVLTPTLKVKRALFEQYFRDKIDRLYSVE